MKNRKGSQFRSQSGRAGFNRNRSQSGRAEFDRNRSQSGRAGFKFGGNGDRSGSRPKSDLVKKVEELVKSEQENRKDNQEIKKQLKEIREIIVKAKVNHFVEEEYEFNVRFVDEAKGMQMIVDSGAPVSIATSKWMEKYLKEMEVNKDDIIEKECNRRFKMGENIYLSDKEITLPVRMKTDNDDFIMKMVTVSVVDREDELFLCGLKTLMEWKAAVYYEKCGPKNDDSQKRVNMKISGSGHQLVKLETLGEISDEDTVFYMEKKGIGANKKDIEKLHRVLNHKGVINMEFAFRNEG